MTQRDPDESQAAPTDGLADDGIAPLVTSAGADGHAASDDADAPTG